MSNPVINLQEDYSLIRAKQSSDFDAAQLLFREYAASLSIDLCFQGFEKELENLPSQYDLPSGGLLLIRTRSVFVGCAGIRRLEEHTGELKRMFIQPAYRAKGLGERLLTSTLEVAKSLGYKKVRLDTLTSMSSAIRLYQRAGFYEIDAYCFNPSQEVLYMEVKLI